ncbi:uncharacterized protein BO95DRAFT_442124 [Aspergillus brunneoviolaceus CBS 621.78]|uniref:Uncharacterized protein n=1 Tax=Aspergillus brunneoviolaceus CBS 621.78 TaxID=1450534 RepID=A0ACD1GBF5_9EURO|nr:hypothetical protein BO95DRAFT_442124 [Aspergillus brunneoviolaceus CBS 621.78]RAH46620.1 hypothetical protein BO95DRAFT_442124 [Aspergillus brunneoviolaceus CBS 621.78]
MPQFIPGNTSNNNTTGLERRLGDPNVEEYVFPILIALAWCNALELLVLCFNTFKRYAGPYFWSLLVASVSILPFGLGYLLKMFDITATHFYLEIAISDLGWAGMVTGQSLVLWSRLHLVLHNRRLLRALFWLIVVDGVLLHGCATALEFATNARPDSRAVSLGFGVVERIQVTWFCVQELLLSGVYIVATARLLRLDSGSPASRPLLSQLLLVNVLIVFLDLAVVAIQWAGFFTFQVTFKALAYSIKLKLEYIILGRLVDVAHIRTQGAGPRFRI